MFPCTKCGLCCQNINGIEELKDFNLGNGTCKHYMDEVGCGIYESRPLVCRVDDWYNTNLKNVMGIKQFYMENASICNALQKKAGLDTTVFNVVIKG